MVLTYHYADTAMVVLFQRAKATINPIKDREIELRGKYTFIRIVWVGGQRGSDDDKGACRPFIYLAWQAIRLHRLRIWVLHRWVGMSRTKSCEVMSVRRLHNMERPSGIITVKGMVSLVSSVCRTSMTPSI